MELLEIKEVEHYVGVVIPNIERELCNEDLDTTKIFELYKLYLEVLRLVAPFDFISYNKYLEIDEDHDMPTKAFYHNRKNHIGEVFKAFNDMEVYDKYDLLILSLPPRIGKEQPLHSKILTPKGWSTMGDMKVGSKVIGYNGKSTTVIGVFPQGTKDVYKVSFDDGTEVECGLDHLWTVQTRDDRRGNKERTVTTESMMKNLYVENGSRKNYSINYVKPIEFENTLLDTDLKPYLLGALLGDGSFVDNTIHFTNIDNDILEKVSSLLPETDCFNKARDITYSIIKKDRTTRSKMGYSLPTDTLTNIKEYGLHKIKSESKFIPSKYLYSTIENRLELLKGLMDTDGYCGNGSYNEYCTVSEQLANDVIELVRSLGGRVTMTTKMGSYTKNGVKIQCKKVYRILFNMEINPFYCNRKAIKFIPRQTRTVKYISNIELIGKEQCQCIMVDSPKHLYVTDGYNLTHNTTTGIRFLSWIIGKYPEHTQLATSYSDNITTSFYIGVMEIVLSERYKQVFPESLLVNQNGKREEIWLQAMKRYPSISFVPVGGSMTGRAEAGKYLYCDDLVSGIEEALSVSRLEKLWQTYTVNCKQRKKDGCKEIHLATQWSVHDVINRLTLVNEDNPRCKIINIPCFDEDGESNFNFNGGFSTEYYKDLQNTMDKVSFDALYTGNTIEREGILYNREDLQYYMELPDEKADSIISVCDSKNLGNDFVSAVIGYVYGDFIYIEDIVYNNGLPETTRPLVANKWLEHKVVRADVELNNGGNYYAEDLRELILKGNGKTSIRIFYSGNNKKIKIITYSDYVKKRFIFKHSSMYSINSEYGKFMSALCSWTQSGANKHDDAPDCVAMLAQLTQDITGNSIKVLNRRELGL